MSEVAQKIIISLGIMFFYAVTMLWLAVASGENLVRHKMKKGKKKRKLHAFLVATLIVLGVIVLMLAIEYLLNRSIAMSERVVEALK